ncbi:MAG TPA: PAS domain S-box protein [Blastocatellia bacterium]|nr:PAS domain S-box protein [Blastocatellia bacterium]
METTINFWGAYENLGLRTFHLNTAIPMAKKVRSAALRYGLPLLSFALILLISYCLRRFFSLNVDLTPLIIGVMIATAWYGGRGPGLLFAIVFELTIDFYSPAPFSLKAAALAFNRLVLFVSLVLFASSRRSAERRLRRQTESLRVTLSSIGDAVIATDINGLINFINPTAEALTGWTMAECVNKPLADVFKIINETTRQPVENPVTKVLRHGAVVGLANHTVLIARDGKEIPIDDSGAPIRAPRGEIIGVVLVFRDITERRQVDETRALLSAIIESSGDAIISKTMDGTIVSWNKGAERLYGYTAKEAEGQLITLLMPPERADDFPAIMEALKRGESIDHFETERMRKNGEVIKVSLSVSPIRNSAGEITGASAIARDMTERVRAEKEREELLAREQAARREAERAYNLSAEMLIREQAARKQAEEASSMKDEFLATISHELRTPLNAILGWAGILLRKPVDTETTAQAVETIERNARAQTQLIEDLLDVSRITTGRLRLDAQAVELPVVIQDAVDTIRPAINAKGIRLQAVLDPRAGPVSGDPSRLQQVVWNLLSNAVKFTPKGGRVEVRLERINSYVEITVSDTGKGISSEFLPYVFDRFRQADSSFTRVHGGLGLGLAIVRQLVELHGGTVEARSAGEGYGATFIVKLPISISRDVARYRAVASEEIDLSVTSNTPEFPPRLDGLRLLIVDDEPDACEMLVTILKGYGAEVRAAGSAAEGLEAVRAWGPDVLISDIEMPYEDGYSFISKVRALPSEESGRTPAIALTAHVRAADRLRALSSGFDAHLGKPMEPVELVTVIASLVRRIGKGRG